MIINDLLAEAQHIANKVDALDKIRQLLADNYLPISQKEEIADPYIGLHGTRKIIPASTTIKTEVWEKLHELAKTPEKM